MVKKKKYLNNKDFYDEICKYKTNGNVISNELACMIKQLTEKYSHSSNWKRYNHCDLEDMRSDAMIACIKALSKFSLDRTNPFAYFTEVVKNTYKYYMKKKYNDDNFKMELVEDAYSQANKPFTNEIKKDINQHKRDKQMRANDAYFDNIKDQIVTKK